MEESKLVTDCAARIEKYARLMYQIAFRRFQARKEDFEDAVTDALLRFWRKCREGKVIDLDIRRYMEWLVRGENKKVFLKQNRELPLESGMIEGLVGATSSPNRADPYPNPEQAVMDDWVPAELIDCLAKLRPYQREGILLDADGLTDTEIAAKMGTRLGTAKTRLKAARGRLQTCLESKGYRQ